MNDNGKFKLKQCHVQYNMIGHHNPPGCQWRPLMLTSELTVNISIYSQLLRCRRPVITDTLIIQTAAKSHTKTNHRFLTEMNSRYYGLSLIMTLTHTVSQQKVVSDSPGLVDFAIGLVNSVINLPDGQVNLFEEFKLQKNCESICSSKHFLGQLKRYLGQ